MSDSKLYSRGRDARRAAKKAGHTAIEIFEVEGKFGWRDLALIGGKEFIEQGVAADPAPVPGWFGLPAADPPAVKLGDPGTRSARPAPKKAKAKGTKRAPRFSFKEVGIAVGTVLISTLVTSEKARVDGDRHIHFRGERHTLSSAALILARETGRNWPRIQGPVYWSLNGRTLIEIRG